MKHKNIRVLKKLGLAITITIFAAIIYTMAAPHTFEAHQTQKLQKTYIQLEQTREKLLNTKANDSKQQQTQNQQIQQLNQQLQDTQKQLQAKASNAGVAYAAPAPAYHSDNWYMEFIFQHESSGNPGSVNSIGACGLGQALPCTKMSSVCGWPASTSCQVSWFSNYAIQRYGSWQAAYYYWINHGNW